jgi:hypothetical protein
MSASRHSGRVTKGRRLTGSLERVNSGGDGDGGASQGRGLLSVLQAWARRREDIPTWGTVRVGVGGCSFE